MTWEAAETVRCTATLGGGKVFGQLQCVLAYDHKHGHVYVNGSWVTDRHGEES